MNAVDCCWAVENHSNIVHFKRNFKQCINLGSLTRIFVLLLLAFLFYHTYQVDIWLASDCEKNIISCVLRRHTKISSYFFANVYFTTTENSQHTPRSIFSQKINSFWSFCINAKSNVIAALIRDQREST